MPRYQQNSQKVTIATIYNPSYIILYIISGDVSIIDEVLLPFAVRTARQAVAEFLSREPASTETLEPGERVEHGEKLEAEAMLDPEAMQGPEALPAIDTLQARARQQPKRQKQTRHRLQKTKRCVTHRAVYNITCTDTYCMSQSD